MRGSRPESPRPPTNEPLKRADRWAGSKTARTAHPDRLKEDATGTDPAAVLTVAQVDARDQAGRHESAQLPNMGEIVLLRAAPAGAATAAVSPDFDTP